MNILPLILLLLLTLSALTLRQVEQFKKEQIVQKEYREFVQHQENSSLTITQNRLADAESAFPDRQLNFRPFYADNSYQAAGQKGIQELTLIFKELIKVLYEEADFYKKIIEKRPAFVEEILRDIQKQRDEKHILFDGTIENLATVKLSDPELQEVFYHMLKGTVSGKENVADYWMIHPDYRKKSYRSLLDFLRDKAIDTDNPCQISFNLAPKELLQAIYNEEIAHVIIERRKEIEAGRREEKSAEYQRLLQEVEKYKKDGISKEIFKIKGEGETGAGVRGQNHGPGQSEVIEEKQENEQHELNDYADP